MTKRQYLMILATVFSVVSGGMTFAAGLGMAHWMIPAVLWNLTAFLLFWREFIEEGN